MVEEELCELEVIWILRPSHKPPCIVSVVQTVLGVKPQLAGAAQKGPFLL